MIVIKNIANWFCEWIYFSNDWWNILQIL